MFGQKCPVVTVDSVNSAFNHMQECRHGFELIVTVKKNVVEKFFIFFSQDVRNHQLNRLKNGSLLEQLVHATKKLKISTSSIVRTSMNSESKSVVVESITSYF